MARAVENFLGDRITTGCVNVKDGDAAKTGRIELRLCGHPCRTNAAWPGRNASPKSAGKRASAISSSACYQAGHRR